MCGRITTIDIWQGAIRQVGPPERDPECRACARGEFPALDVPYGRHRVRISMPDGPGSYVLADLRAAQLIQKVRTTGN